ncbi:MAG: hypothetical protein A2133_07705 [Actinobacteria bacterium RBG_16_64_13]|nr:MAG: hypothetical protein A2133_07705 [Actinobacteria bacterium RBG_16_64_13]
MSMSRNLVLGLALTLCAGGSVMAQESAPQEDKKIALFNRTDLAGWPSVSVDPNATMSEVCLSA